MAFGRLERGRDAQPMSDINVTPLVDVMLVLLVIFIITAPLLTSALRLNLPKAGSSANTEAPKFISLALDPSGKTYINDQMVDGAGLTRALETAARANPDTEVQLRADQSVPYGRVVQVMDEAQKAGLNRIAFVAEAKPVQPGAPAPATP